MIMNKDDISAHTSGGIWKVITIGVIAAIAMVIAVFALVNTWGDARAADIIGATGTADTTGTAGSIGTANACNAGNTGNTGNTGNGQNGAPHNDMPKTDTISAHDAYGSLTPADITTVPEENEGVSYAAGEVLLLFDEGITLSQAHGILESLGLGADDASISVALDEDTLLRAFIDADVSVNFVLESARTQSGLSYAQPNFIYSPTDIGTDEVDLGKVPSDEAASDKATSDEAASGEIISDPLTPNTTEINDPYASAYQWHLPDIRAYDAWDIQRGEDATAAVAVIDTGADASHPDLEGNLVAGYNAVTGSTNYQDISYHGSHVCGIISSITNNGVGTSGVTYNAKVIPVMSGRGSGSSAYFYSYDLSEAYQYLLTDADSNGVPDLTEEYGMHTVNMSLGGDWSEDATDKAVLNYIDVAYEKISLRSVRPETTIKMTTTVQASRGRPTTKHV